MTGTSCSVDCHRPTGNAAHCTVCHQTFGGVTGFDGHRKEGRCLDPATLGMELRGQIWKRPMDENARLRMAALAVAGPEPVPGTSGNPGGVS